MRVLLRFLFLLSNMSHSHEHAYEAPLTVDEPSQVYRFKLQCLFIIWITGLIGGVLPLKLKVKERYLSLGNVLSGGFFLAAGFSHMLVEAVEGFEGLDITWFGKELPFAYLLCMVGVLFTFFLEKVVFANHKHSHSHFEDEQPSSSSTSPEETRSHHREHHEAEKSRGIVKPENIGNSTNWEQARLNMYILAILLTVHSVIEGVALGIEDTLADTTSILVAIVGHKIFDAFAIGINLAKNNIQANQILKLIALFACTTPIGIIAGITFLPNPRQSVLAESIKAISAGTFIYIGLVEIILEEFEDSKDRFLKFLLVSIGALIMSALSANGHSH